VRASAAKTLPKSVESGFVLFYEDRRKVALGELREFLLKGILVRLTEQGFSQKPAPTAAYDEPISRS
jgi:hypothetical protein